MDYKDAHAREAFRRRARYEAVFIGLILAAMLIVVLNINIGSVPIGVKEIARIIFSRQGDPTQVNIIWKIRLPRILTAALLGGALALSGFLLQTFFATPIAGPFILGISSGAKLILSLTLIGFLSRGVAVGSVALILASFVGAMLSMSFVLLISSKVKRIDRKSVV